MKKANKFLKVYIKNCINYLDNLIIINDFDFENIKLDEKPYADFFHLLCLT